MVDKLCTHYGNYKLTIAEQIMEYWHYLFSYHGSSKLSNKSHLSFHVAIKLHLLPLHFIENKNLLQMEKCITA